MNNKFTTSVNQDPVVTTIIEQIANAMNKEADKIIGELTEEFKQRLINKKNVAISELIRSIEMQRDIDNVDSDLRFTIIMKSPMRSID